MAILKLKSIINNVSLEKGIVTKVSKPKFKNCVDLKNINKVQNIIKKEKFCPLIIDSFIEKDKLISQRHFIEGKKITKVNSKNLIKIIIEIKKLQSVEGKNIKIWDVKDDFLNLLQQIESPWKKYEKYLWKIEEINSQDENMEKYLSHCDLHIDNFIITNDRAFLIDWDYSRMANKYFDYASLVFENNLDKEDIKLLLVMTQLNESVLYDWVFYHCIFWMVWANRMYEIDNNEWYIAFFKEKQKFLKTFSF